MEQYIQKIKNYIAMMEDINIEEIEDDSHIIKDIGMSSLDIVEMMCYFEEEYSITIELGMETKLNTIQSVATYISSKVS